MKQENIEVWKPVVGYEGLYEVSDMGRVKSIDRIITEKTGKQYPRKGQILKLLKLKNGYYSVNLWNRTGKTHYVHRLVAEAFIPNPCPEKYNVINHKDENRLNNSVGNLEWCTLEYNFIYGTAQERRVAHTDYKTLAEKQKNRPDKSKTVYQYTLSGDLVKKWSSTMEVQREMGFRHSHISACCRNCYGKLHNVFKGFVWSYTPLV